MLCEERILQLSPTLKSSTLAPQYLQPPGAWWLRGMSQLHHSDLSSGRELCPDLALAQASCTQPPWGSLDTEAGQKLNIGTRYPGRKQKEGGHFRWLKKDPHLRELQVRDKMLTALWSKLGKAACSSKRGNCSHQHKVCIFLFSSNNFDRRQITNTKSLRINR